MQRVLMLVSLAFRYLVIGHTDTDSQPERWSRRGQGWVDCTMNMGWIMRLHSMGMEFLRRTTVELDISKRESNWWLVLLLQRH